MKESSLNQSVTGSAENALSVLSNAIATIQQQLDAVMAKKDELLERRVTLYATPLSDAEIVQFVSELVDYRAAGYSKQLRSYGWMDKLKHPARYGVAKRDCDPLSFEDAEYALSRPLSIPKRLDSLSEQGGWLPIFLSNNEFQNWPYFYLGGLIKEKLCAEILKGREDAQADADALTMDKRREEIQSIAKEIEQLDAEAARLRGEISRLSNPVLISAKRLQGATGSGV